MILDNILAVNIIYNFGVEVNIVEQPPYKVML